MNRWNWNRIIAFIGLVCCLGCVIGLEDEKNTKNEEKILPNKNDDGINFFTPPRSSLKSIISTELGSNNEVSRDKIPTNKIDEENAGPLSSLESIISTELGSKNEVSRDKIPTNKIDKENAGPLSSLESIISTELGSKNEVSRDKIPTNKIDKENAGPLSSLKSIISTELGSNNEVSRDIIPINKIDKENAGPLSSLESIISTELGLNNEVSRDKLPINKIDNENEGPLSSLKSLFRTGFDMENEDSRDKTPTKKSDNEINFDTDFLSSLKSLFSYTQFMKKLDDYYPIDAHAELKKEIKETEEETNESKMRQTKKSFREETPNIIFPFDNFFENRILESGSLFPDINKIFEPNTSFKNNRKISEVTIFDPFYNIFPDIIIQPIQPKRSCCMKNKQRSNQHSPNCAKNKTKKAIRKDDAQMELINRDLLVCVLPGLLGFIVVVTGVEIIRRHNKMVKTTRFLSPQYNNIC